MGHRFFEHLICAHLKVSSGDTQAFQYSLNARRLDQLIQIKGMQYYLGGDLVLLQT